ncbi:MAG: exopolysaccharide Pel transporter PelG [Pseudomonadales bacterium]|nr:exopolysaccharide Pel transporter PelG [Pseudomonadales bacterium]
MAGIGFELRKLLERDSLLGMLQAYAYAGIISSGPWILSILGILLIGVMSLTIVVPSILITQFQVSVTYLIACSLTLTGFAQLAFTRFCADRLFEKKADIILPNFRGLSLLITLLAGSLALPVLYLGFRDTSEFYRLLMVAGFVIMCNIWIATLFLSSMKQYKSILLMFALGYSMTVTLSLALRHFKLEGLLSGFVLGHFILLAGMILLIEHNFPSPQLLRFDFLKKQQIFISLAAVGLFYNLGLWIDKFMFWMHPSTSVHVLGLLRASPIYDIPVFLAYLSIIPGMAVFLVKMETDFVEFYDAFYEAVREGGSLEELEQLRNDIVFTVRQGIYQIIKIQTISALLILVVGRQLLHLLGISELYLPLLFVNLISAGLQVVFLGILNVFFYLDQRRMVLWLTVCFCLCNTLLTGLSLWLGPGWFGDGYAVSMLIAVALGFYLLTVKLDKLEYETFMFQ